MLTLQETLSRKLADALEAIGASRDAAIVTRSDRPELSEFQSNAALRSAKAVGKPPLAIAADLAAQFADDPDVEVSAVKPGFLNFRLRMAAVGAMLDRLAGQGHDLPRPEPKTLVIDYGGPNVAKPLHIGHLRAAIIGESVKRIARAMGHTVYGDVHLGDWGLQMGQILAQMEEDHPDWPYFAEPFEPSAVPGEPPFTNDELNEIYPRASARSKEDETFLEKARAATAALQTGSHPGYVALWQTFVDVSVATIRQDYDRLGVTFDYWYGESHAHPYLAPLVEQLRRDGIATLDDGALIVPVAEGADKKEIPPLMLVKSNGSVGYGATDLATISQRKQDWSPDEVIYVVDKRQAEHFVQVFRASEKAGLLSRDQLIHVGFGTMNGKDGRPFKTREGGVVRLSDMIDQARSLTLAEAGFSAGDLDAEKEAMIEAITIAAIKFGDLQNPYNTDYVFDPEQFVRFEGKTGPYIQYAAVRAKAILDKAGEVPMADFAAADLGDEERALAIQLLAWPLWLSSAHREHRPDFLCSYAYDLARVFNVFYKHCPVLGEDVDADTKARRLVLTRLVGETLRAAFDLLAIPVPDRMLRGEG